MELSDSKNLTNNRPSNNHIREKWRNAVGKGGLTGYLALPEALIRGQHRLGLSSTEMMVLINVLMHWWFVDRKPFPGNHTIAKRMNVNTRTVQRAFATLEKKKLIHRDVHRHYDDKNNVHSAYREIDLDGLVSRLSEIADDLERFSEAARMEREERANSHES